MTDMQVHVDACALVEVVELSNKAIWTIPDVKLTFSVCFTGFIAFLCSYVVETYMNVQEYELEARDNLSGIYAFLNLWIAFAPYANC